MSAGLRVVVEADGGSRGNPGPAGYGAVVKDAATGEVLLERYAALGTATNNVAEYSGLIAGLRAAAELNAARVDIRMDSKLVIEQMSGRWQIKNPGLRPLAAEAAQLVARFQTVSFDWIPRERNREADALANRAMDEAAGKAVPDVPAAAPQPRSWAPPELDNATRLILVRHGATAMTAQGRYSGRGDVPLTDEGEAQAMAAAGRVAGLSRDVAVVLTSPLARCGRTAELIAAEVGGVPVTVLDDLIECDFGLWEGKTFAEVQEGWPDEMTAWLSSTSVAPPGGESFQAVAKRVRGALAKIQQAYEGQVVVVVSHVTPIKLILRDALAAGDAFLHRLFLDAAGVSTMDIWPDGNIAVRSVNETAHLR
ncbi:bifunctional RNase H/acid phosphatase [Actinoplanes sp. SE50]|uniref:bifunctional RNase H/acid phosphatase n=1 Tax=unclassified Actinoplanes TaxID=2626549 RepID=UPI00023EC212|nr:MULTISPECIES: bifunctional RNase H/acid phosphatase [unclassified Actinoplanes]AEV82442.1 bifunctional RNase H/acid phosphatase [Actinoplanes sp. SE50/110]ATO80839.1 bifunctional RNase H/acid phosphatase [Actinoplanes sp. SE50]SLL98246.1 bifunctional RNase H/acid phosphatase [Actinoplanes sp. SE50/110]